VSGTPHEKDVVANGLRRLPLNTETSDLQGYVMHEAEASRENGSRPDRLLIRQQPQNESVVIYEVYASERQLVKDILGNYVKGCVPDPYFIIATDATCTPDNLTDEQLDDAGLIDPFTNEARPVRAFSGTLLTILSYKQHKQNGVFGLDQKPDGSDLRTFVPPRVADEQMFDGIVFLVPATYTPLTMFEEMAISHPPLIRRLTRPQSNVGITGQMSFLESRAPQPLRTELCDILQRQAQTSAAKHSTEPDIVTLGKDGRVHVYDGWLALLQDLLYVEVSDLKAIMVNDSGKSWSARRKSLRSHVQEDFEAQIRRRLECLDDHEDG